MLKEAKRVSIVDYAKNNLAIESRLNIFVHDFNWFYKTLEEAYSEEFGEKRFAIDSLNVVMSMLDKNENSGNEDGYAAYKVIQKIIASFKAYFKSLSELGLYEGSYHHA